MRQQINKSQPAPVGVYFGPRISECWKVAYESAPEAHAALRRIIKDRPGGSAYRCWACGKWHLSSQGKR